MCGLLPVEDDVEDGVKAVLAREDATKLALLDREGVGFLAGPIEDPRNEAVSAQPPGNGAPGLVARLDVQLDSLTGHTGGQV
jgi:hypothetical protein